MKEKTSNIILFLLIGILAVSCGILGYTIGDKTSVSNIIKEINPSEKLICNSTDIILNAECLHDELSKFYKYNISQIGKDLSDDELKKEGGVCNHYAEWYVNHALDIFNKKLVTFGTGNDSAHEIAIISNNKAYCTLDQLRVNCIEFGGSNDE